MAAGPLCTEMTSSDKHLCPTLRLTRQQFERPFCEFVREVFLKHPDWPCFKVPRRGRGWLHFPVPVRRAGVSMTGPAASLYRRFRPNDGRRGSGPRLTWRRSGSTPRSSSMCVRRPPCGSWAEVASALAGSGVGAPLRAHCDVCAGAHALRHAFCRATPRRSTPGTWVLTPRKLPPWSLQVFGRSGAYRCILEEQRVSVRQHPCGSVGYGEGRAGLEEGHGSGRVQWRGCAGPLPAWACVAATGTAMRTSHAVLSLWQGMSATEFKRMAQSPGHQAPEPGAAGEVGGWRRDHGAWPLLWSLLWSLRFLPGRACTRSTDGE